MHVKKKILKLIIINELKKTRTKVVHKNVSQGCNQVKRSESNKIQGHTSLNTKLNFHIIL